jgi:hypothetical protein
MKKIIIFLVILYLSSIIAQSQTSCSSPWWAVTKTYIISPLCTLDVDLCVYCHPEAPIVDIPATYIFQFIRESVMNDYASFCGAQNCDPGPPLRIYYHQPICVKTEYKVATNKLLITPCSNINDNNICYKSYDICWDSNPPPGHVSITLINSSSNGSPDCAEIKQPSYPVLPWTEDWETICYEIPCSE